jgi:hypothetical protein
LHIADYVVYRVTKRNVGPWGLSAYTERRPMYLSPQLSTTVPLPEATAHALAAAFARLDAEDQLVEVPYNTHSNLVGRFPGPLRLDPLADLTPGPGRGRGRGLFGNSQVWVTETGAANAHRLLSSEVRSDRWALPEVGAVRSVEVEVGDRRVRLAARVPATVRRAL